MVSPHKGTVTRNFAVFVVSLNKLLNKHSIGRYFETPWRSFDVAVMYWIFAFEILHFSWLHRRIVCNDCNAAYSRLMLFLWSVIECYQYSLWHNINPYLYPIPVSLNGMFVFWIYIVITDDKSALVRQMAWYRQATNHYLITWTNDGDASWHHIASLGLNRLINCGSVTLCNDTGLSKSCLTAPSHYLNQCWPQKNTSATSHYLFKTLFKPRGQWLKYT